MRSATATASATVVQYCDAAHRAQVIALWKSEFNYNAPHNKPELSIDKKLEADDGLFLVAISGEHVIGTVMAGYDGHRGWIYSVAVAQKHRRRRIGTMLMAAAEKALIERGCVKINLQVMEGNESVTAFYTKLGYAVEKRISLGKRIDQNCKMT